MKNPFVYGKVITHKNDFCPRPKEEKRIFDNILGNQNTYLIGERRVGKSSLAQIVLDNIVKQHKYLTVEVDFRGVASEANIQRIILQAVLRAAKEIRDTEWVLSLFSKFKPTATPTEDGKMEFSITANLNSSLSGMTLLETFEYIEKINERNKLVVFFDEFPEILKVENGSNILGQMRSKIQNQNIPYVFAGSHRGEMRNIFENPDNKYHFYNSATAMNISKFNVDEIVSFCSSKFLLGNRQVEAGVLDDVYSLTNGITGDIYQVCHELWDLVEKGPIKHRHVEQAVSDICERKNEIYGEIVSKLSPIQRKGLFGIVLEKGINLITTDFASKYKMKSKATVKTVVDSFIDKNILYKKDDKIIFYDPFFYIWLKKKYKI